MQRDKPHHVCIVGSGNWGSAIAKIVGHNAKESDLFADRVTMWVYEEIIDGEKLTDIINSKHENVKYLPGISLPENVVAIPDVVEAARGANLFVFVLPHQFIVGVCKKLREADIVSHESKAISLIKGMIVEDGSPRLISDLIAENLGVDVSVLSGANIANEVAKGEFSEATIGYRDKDIAQLWKHLFHTERFRINVVPDVAGVELCGALKNVVALGAGFCDGLGYAANAKAAIMRVGLQEMRRFAEKFYHGIQGDTFFESCGVADLIVTCFGGRNRKVAAAFARPGNTKTFEELEQEMLNGQKLQGTLTTMEVHEILESKQLVEHFPLFDTIYKIAFEGADPSSIVAFPHYPTHHHLHH